MRLICSEKTCDYALKWDGETQMSVNAHAALLSQFAKAGEFLALLAEPGTWRGAAEGWQCAEREVRLGSWAKARRVGKRQLNPPTEAGEATTP